MSVDLLNLEPPLDNPSYAPGVKAKKLTVQLNFDLQAQPPHSH